MARRLHVLVAALGGALLLAGGVGPAGCASAPRGEAFQPEVVEPSRAVMYIYRLPKQGLAVRRAQIYVDQEPVGELFPGQYMARVVSPGTYLVRVEAESSTAREVRMVPGDIAYLRVNGASKLTIDLPESATARQQINRTTRAAD
jgi:hypothetical protein